MEKSLGELVDEGTIAWLKYRYAVRSSEKFEWGDLKSALFYDARKVCKENDICDDCFVLFRNRMFSINDRIWGLESKCRRLIIENDDYRKLKNKNSSKILGRIGLLTLEIRKVNDGERLVLRNEINELVGEWSDGKVV